MKRHIENICTMCTIHILQTKQAHSGKGGIVSAIVIRAAMTGQKPIHLTIIETRAINALAANSEATS